MKYLFLAFVAVFLFSCSSKTVFEKAVEVEEKGWHYKNILDYQFSIENSQQDFTLFLNLEYLKSYAYSNIIFFVDVIDPNEGVLRDTIECILSTPTGKMLGDVSGDEVDHQFVYRPRVNFPVKGEYQIKIQHAMRDTLLKKMNSVGIELREFEEFR